MTIISLEYDWTPGADAALFVWEPGEPVRLQERDGSGFVTGTMLSGEIRTHPAVPGGYVFEVITDDDGKTWAVDSKRVWPSEERETAIRQGRACLSRRQ